MPQNMSNPVVARVAQRFGLSAAELRGPSSVRAVTSPRQLAQSLPGEGGAPPRGAAEYRVYRTPAVSMLAMDAADAALPRVEPVPSALRWPPRTRSGPNA